MSKAAALREAMRSFRELAEGLMINAEELPPALCERVNRAMQKKHPERYARIEEAGNTGYFLAGRLDVIDINDLDKACGDYVNMMEQVEARLGEVEGRLAYCAAEKNEMAAAVQQANERAERAEASARATTARQEQEKAAAVKAERSALARRVAGIVGYHAGLNVAEMVRKSIETWEEPKC